MGTTTAQEILDGSDRKLLISLLRYETNRQPSAEYAERIGQPETAETIRSYVQRLEALIAKFEGGV